MKNKLITIIIAAVLFTAATSQVEASSKISASSAALMQDESITAKKDARVQILRDYLIKKNSPLADSAETFVKEADEHDLDWKLVVSISGIESSFGKRIPMNSYNGWGWGVYGDNVLRFKSWDDAISTISEALKVKYIDRMGTDNLDVIGRTYAASPTWSAKVGYFMRDLESFEKSWSDDTLSISL